MFGNILVHHTFIVCNDLEHEFLIGMDILTKHKIVIDVPNKFVCTSNGQEKFLRPPVSLKNRVKVRCMTTTVIPAHSAGHLIGKIPSRTKSNFEGVIDPYLKLAEEKGILVIGTLSYTEKNSVPIHFVNTMPHDITIYRNQLVAFMDPFEKFKRLEGIHKVTTENRYYNSSIDIPRLPDALPESVTRENGKWENPQLLFDQLKIDEIDISDESKQKLKALVAEFSHCFSRDRFDLGKASFYEAKIILKQDYTPKWVPVREIPYKLQHLMDEEVRNMEKAGLIKKTRFSLWNLAVMLVPKKGGHRFVQDSRAANLQSLQDNYHITNISTILDKMTDCNYLSSLDFTSSFNQLGLNDSEGVSCFYHAGDRYQWTRLVQGHKSSSSQFSRCMAQLFSPSTVPFGSNLLAYIDDLCLGSKTEEEHLKRLRFVLERLSWGNLKLNPKNAC